MGQAVLMMCGLLDLSTGIQLAFVNVIAIMMPQEMGVPVALGWFIALLSGVVVSLFCGFCIVKLRLPSMLTTFSITYIIKGVNVLIMSVPQGKVERDVYKRQQQMTAAWSIARRGRRLQAPSTSSW